MLETGRTIVDRPPSRSRLRDREFMRIVSPITLVVFWQLCSSSGLLPPMILASPIECALTAWHLLNTGELEIGLAVSFVRVCTGFAIAFFAGTALAVVSGVSQLGETIVDPPLQMLKAMPFLGLLPLFILWFGIGETPKIALVATGAIFPIYLTLHAGIRGVDYGLLEAGRALGLSRAHEIIHVVLPTALPSLFVGERYGLSVAWLSLVVGEQINAGRGLGYLIGNARDFLQNDVIVVCLLVCALLGLATDAFVRMLEGRFLRYRTEQSPQR